jgi:hypothetical protein
MPLYTFELHDGDRLIEDETRQWFSDRERAVGHAQDVARELMTAREMQTRAWRLDVYEDGARVGEISFASIDATLDHLKPHLRTMVEASADSIRSMRQTISAARDTIRESRALVARSRGKPYLAAVGGRPTISPPIPEIAAQSAATAGGVKIKEVA